MAISVDPLTHIILVPRADLTLVQASPEVRSLDLDDFRLWLKAWEDDQEGIVQLKTHTHNTEVTLSGLNYARTIEVLSPYTVEFEDAQYSVNCSGANHNLSDVKVVNQVSLIVNNAAGLVSSPDIEYASFQSGVWIDTVTGDDTNKGNEQEPVKTVTRALVVANYRGFNKMYAQSNVTIGAGHDFDDFIIQGQSHVITQLTIEAGASCERLTVDNCNVEGVLDGDNEIRNCVVGDIVYFNGHIHDCGLHGMFYLGGANHAVVANCSTIDADDPPIIDMGGSGQSLAMPNYSGLVTIQNLDSTTDEVGIGLNAGMVFIDSTVVDGELIISGTGILSHTQTGSEDVNSDGLMSKDTISTAVWDEQIGDHILLNTTGHQMYHAAYKDMVHLDAVNGSSGTTFPTGTEESPVDNLTDALAIANNHNFSLIHIVGAYTMNGEDITGMTIAADRSLGNSLTITSMVNTDSCYFQDLTILGALSGATRFTTCVIGALTGFSGGAKNCLLTNSIDLVGTGNCYFTNCDTYVTSSSYVTINQYGASLNIIRGRGRFGIANKTSVNRTSIDLASGFVYIDSTCNVGEVNVGGIGSLQDDSSVGCVVSLGALNTHAIADGVWDENTADHTDAGTYGHELATKADLFASASTNSTSIVSSVVTYGTVLSGSETSALVRDGTKWEIQEDAADGLSMDMTFNLPDEDKAGVINIFGHYTGLPAGTHFLDLWFYNYSAAAWELLNAEFMPGGNNDDTSFSHEFYERHIDRSNSNEVQVRLVHNVTSYSASHEAHFDFIELTSIDIVTAEEIADSVWDSLKVDHTISGSYGEELATVGDLSGGITVTAETDPIVKLAALLNL